MYDDEPKIIRAEMSIDDRGVLTHCNEFQLVGVQRFYTISNHRRGFVRAWHGHRLSCTWLWPIKGIWRIAAGGTIADTLADRDERIESGNRLKKARARVQSYFCDPTSMLFVPGGWYNGHQNMTDDGILGVFSTATVEQVKDDDVRLWWNHWSIWEEQQR